MDICEFRHLVHSRLSIVTSHGNFEGLLKFVSITRQRLTFEHVYELPSHNYLGTMHILLSSISSWRLLKSVEENFEISNFDSSDKLLSSEFDKNERIDCSEVVELDPEKYFFEYLPEHLKNNCPNDFCIIDSIDTVFYRALKQISELTAIGASLHGPRISRSGILTWLCLSTPACVFLFDIEKLGNLAFKKGLKDILEAEKIEKVIHDSREITNCLFHLYNTEVKSVFDTQVADYLINMQMCTGKKLFKYLNSLDSCLFKYLKVPQQFLYNHNKSILFEDEVNFYKKRPISKDFINVLIKSSMYLLLLKNKQEILLMNPYEQAVALYLNSLRSASDYQVYTENIEFSHSPPDCLLESTKLIHFMDIPQSCKDVK